MLDDGDISILAWLHANEKLPQPNDPSPGLTELIRRLRNNVPLGADVSNALAGALEPIGSSRVKLVLGLQYRKRGRGRPPKRAVDLAFEQHKLASAIDAEDTPKVEFKVLDATGKAGVSVRTGYSARATKVRARQSRNNS